MDYFYFATYSNALFFFELTVLRPCGIMWRDFLFPVSIVQWFFFILHHILIIFYAKSSSINKMSYFVWGKVEGVLKFYFSSIIQMNFFFFALIVFQVVFQTISSCF